MKMLKILEIKILEVFNIIRGCGDRYAMHTLLHFYFPFLKRNYGPFENYQPSIMLSVPLWRKFSLTYAASVPFLRLPSQPSYARASTRWSL